MGEKTTGQKQSELAQLVFDNVTHMDYCPAGTYFISKTATYWQHCAINQMTP